jgi:DNA-binding NarL/FixJ family response regulator
MTRVLLADDHELMRRLMRAVLATRPGFDVIAEAADGDEALELALGLEPDLVVLDLAMPGIDGLQVAKALRRRRPGCAILVLSAFEAGRVEAAALAAGADRYVEKGAGLAAAADAAEELRRAAAAGP